MSESICPQFEPKANLQDIEDLSHVSAGDSQQCFDTIGGCVDSDGSF